MNRRYRQIQIRNMNEPAPQPIKWLFAIVVFILAMSVTFDEVGGDSLANPYKGGFVDNQALETVFVLPDHQNANSPKAPILLKRR